MRVMSGAHSVGHCVAQADHYSEWTPGAEFKRSQEYSPKRSKR